MDHVLTTSAVARAAGVSESRIRAYADAGIIESSRDSAGRRIYATSAVEQARDAFRRRTHRARRV